MSEILDILGTFSSLFLDFVSGIINLFSSLFSFIAFGFEFIIACILEFGNFLNLGLLDSLPQFFSYGIYALFCVIMLIIILKLFQVFKFW